jgi:hypothetical protein
VENLSSKNFLFYLEKNEISINPLTLLISLIGPMDCNPILTVQDIKEFCLKMCIEKNKKEYCDIAFSDKLEKQDIIKLLENISSKKHIKNEEIKCAVFLLEKNISKLPIKYSEGLLYLTRFWSKFNFPKYMPHIVQGLNNDIKPEDYYSEENYIRIKKSHLRWLNETKKKLRKIS